jgi:hypothetical protein
MSVYFPYEIYVGSEIIAYSFELPASLAAVFIESDRVPVPPEEEQDDDRPVEYRYEATVKTIRERLEIMGYTSDRWREELESFREDQLEQLRAQIDEEEENGNSVRHLERSVLIVERSPAERWIKTLTAMVSDGWGWSRREGRSAVLAKSMTEDEYGPIQMPFSDQRCLLRAMADMEDAEETVQFDFGTAVWNQNVDPKTPFSLQAASSLREGAQAVEKVIILTEGKSDGRILGRSLERLFPQVSHLFSVFDHDAFKSSGGAGELERLARGFAGAGVSNRTVVLFDNDTAGLSASQRLIQAKLPDNFRVLNLPDLELANEYPTIGPTGAAVANINGSACGIELYCGPYALTGKDGNLIPIQWTGYDQAMGRYQGEPIDKAGIHKRFFQSLERSSDPINDEECAAMRTALRHSRRSV